MLVFLTGEKQIGKSTAICRFIELHRELSLGGYFTIHDTEEIIMKPAGDLNHPGFVVGIKKIEGRKEIFENEGLELLKSSKNADLIIMDEIGWMESDAVAFSEEVKSIIKSGKNVLGVLRKDLSTNLASFIRNNATLIEVTQANRDSIPAQLESLQILK